MSEFSMREMIDKGVHFGHKKQYWNPEMAPYIYGVHERMHIINLELTKPMFINALLFIEQIVLRKGRIVFVGTKYAAQDIVVEQAQRCGMPYVNRRWLGGMLTNFKTIRRSVKRLEDLEVQQKDDAFAGMTKKERLVVQREHAKLFDLVGGIKGMASLPSALFVLDVGQDSIAVKEANMLGIPVVGVVDTNNSPQGIDYVIPGNDDAMSALEFYTTVVTDVIVGAQQKVQAEEKLAAEKLAAEGGHGPTVKKMKRVGDATAKTSAEKPKKAASADAKEDVKTKAPAEKSKKAASADAKEGAKTKAPAEKSKKAVSADAKEGAKTKAPAEKSKKAVSADAKEGVKPKQKAAPRKTADTSGTKKGAEKGED